MSYPVHPILLIDDETYFLHSAAMTLKSAGIGNVRSCSDSRKALGTLEEMEYSAILLDVMMPHISGDNIFAEIRSRYPELPVIMLTAINEVETAVDFLKAGAFDYLVKPVDDARLINTLRRAIEYRQMSSENTLLKEYLLSGELKNPAVFESIITVSEQLTAVFKYIEAIGNTPFPVLITGETGVGKERIARAIHDVSHRDGEFVAVNVAGLDDNLFSDTLFGHRKGAFTGADSDRKGLIDRAYNGTLFLDEIGDLKMESQVKLLRLLQEGTFYALGADTARVSDARIVVATHQDLAQRQQEETFRADLYYRLSTHHIKISPLRERPEDIRPLVEHFLQIAAKKLDRKRPSAPPELFILLQNYPFPGNVRELEAMVFDAVSRHEAGVISLKTFRDRIGNSAENPLPASKQGEQLQFPLVLPTLKEIDALLIAEALKRADGNQTIAAQLLGLTRKALSNRLARLDKNK
ncbi:MAG: sigma-54-dependent transcriptional regulator [Calditrichia bacterium]